MSRQIKNNKLLCLFDNHLAYPLYEQMIREDGNSSIIIRNRDTKIIDIFDSTKNQFKYFIFIHKFNIVFNEDNIMSLIDKNLDDDEKILKIHVNNTHILTVLRYKNIINMNREGCVYKNLFHMLKILTSKTLKINADEYTINCYNNIDMAFYENDTCLFAFFDQCKPLGIVGSYCYFNKNNQKIFNIENNIFGKIQKYDVDTISIQWIIANDYKICNYIKEDDMFISTT